MSKDPPADVAVNIQSAKLLVCATVLAAVGFGAMLTLMKGVELIQFDPHQDPVGNMLDTYNSKLATITSAVLPPMGKILAVIVSLGGLCFASNRLMAPQTGVGAMVGMIVVSVGMNFVISNGFNSMNVQPQVLPMQAIMNASDLQAAPTATMTTGTPTSSRKSTSSNVDPMVLNETVFCTLLHPSQTTQTYKCSAMQSTFDFRGFGYGVSFGFPSTPWQAQLLPNGQAPSKILEISLNSSVTNAHKMPMNLSTASSLMAHMMLFADELLTDNTFNIIKNALAATTHWRTETGTNQPTQWATFNDVFYPGGIAADSDANQAAFVNTTASLLRNAFAKSTVHAVEEAVVQWTRNELMDGVVFEAMTMDLPMISGLELTNEFVRTSNDVYANTVGCPASSFVVPLSDYCNTEGCNFVIDEVMNQGKNVYPDPLVRAIAECKDPDLGIGFLEGGDFTMRCNSNKTTGNSMLVVAVARRLRGAGMYYHKLAVDGPYNRFVEFAGMRKYYSVLVGRLSWKATDQSIAHHGQCNSTSCVGLRAPLTNADKTSTGQVLLVGESALPVPRLHMYNYGQDPSKSLWIPLVTWDRAFVNAYILNDQDGTFGCHPGMELPMKRIDQNRLYMEHPLQPSYMAALYFLFQDGVVRDLIPLTNSSTKTLQFDGNVRTVGLRASIPPLNAMLTLIGCGIVGIVCLLLAILSPKLARKMERDLSPHIVAKMLLNGTAFPAVLMECQVGTSEVTLKPLKQFTVGAVILSGKDDSDMVPVTEETLVHVSTSDDKHGKTRVIPITSG